MICPLLFDERSLVKTSVWSSEIGHGCVIIPQAVDKRQPVVPAPVNTAATKLITSSQAAAGKLGFHVGQSAASPTVSPAVQAPVVPGGGLLAAKKPPISRGVPPPVPPNKPVVPPKKEAAAYLRRPESMQPQSGPQQDTVKYGKQTATPQSHGGVTSATTGVAPPVQVHQQPLPASIAQAAAEEEVSNKTADSR